MPRSPSLPSRRRFLQGAAGGAGLVALGGGAGALLTACEPATPYYPPAAGAWAYVDPATVGWNTPKLVDAVTWAMARNTQSLLILHGGRIMLERRGAGLGVDWSTDIASAQKSVMSFLVGQRFDAGTMAMTTRVTDRLGRGWSRATVAQEDAVQVGHLITMTAGLRKLAFEAKPGTQWRYDNDSYQQTWKVLQADTRTPVDTWCRSKLFTPIGVSSASRWAPRPFMTDPLGVPLLGLTMTARDAARFGLLVQRDGVWGSRRLISSAQLRAATTSSQTMNPSYGRLWWLNGKAKVIRPGSTTAVDGPLVPGAPADLLAALGAGDQKIYVCRSLDLVVVRLGGTAPGDIDQGLWTRLMAAAPGRR